MKEERNVLRGIDESWSRLAGGEFCSLQLLEEQKNFELRQQQQQQQHKIEFFSQPLLYCQCSAPVNIAVIKYWGKRDEVKILPTNSSLSVTMDQEDLKTTTLVLASERFSFDRMWLNYE